LSPWQDAELAGRVAVAFREGTAPGLLHLGTKALNVLLPSAAAWWREFARRYLTQLCHLPDLDQVRKVDPLVPPAAPELLALQQSAPPRGGGEYLNGELLATFWDELDRWARAAIAAHPQGAGAWLKEAHPLWRMVGRVSLHLAENRQHPTHP